METAHAVGDGKLTDEELGVIARRVAEITRRINEGTIDKKSVMQALQNIIEGKAKQMVEPCPRPHRQSPMDLEKLSLTERRKSRAPLRLRLDWSKKRLYYHYRAFLNRTPTSQGKALHHEDVIALMWEAENIPKTWLNHGWTPVQTILDDFHASKHDRAIVASTLQWLGTNGGQSFLKRLVATAKLDV